VKNLVDTRFFAPELCAARRPKAPLIPSEKTPARISPRGLSDEQHVSEEKNIETFKKQRTVQFSN
jgi:hypothetical protein